MQIEAINVDTWRVDEEHAIFPIGTRDKQMLWSPEARVPQTKANWPYLFKLSRKEYPDQFWMEVVAWIIGVHIGIDVPKALPAIRNDHDGTPVCGALLEWFYDPTCQNFVHAADFFHKLIPDFDDKLGTQHNVGDLSLICRAHSRFANLQTDWRAWLYDFLLFDTLIGNTDRHQENWGIVFLSEQKGSLMSPFFDNGTSLGHERFPDRVKGWKTPDLDRYIGKGKHHIRFVRSEPRKKIGHIDSIDFLLQRVPGARPHLEDRLNFNFEALVEQISNLCSIDVPLAFTQERAEWIIRLLRRRFELLHELLEK
ncbi:hypothetical protein [Aeromonas veronii]|uniref:hypothetical protein n=1 Tax=Aeromonas veronii TaxID=654 RepID=UPI003B9EF2C9